MAIHKGVLAVDAACPGDDALIALIAIHKDALVANAAGQNEDALLAQMAMYKMPS